MRSESLLKLIKSQHLDYERFISGQIKVIGSNEYPTSDVIANTLMTYSKWVERHTEFPIIKVEGLENIQKLKIFFNRFKIKDIHLFISQHAGKSFNWHFDTVDVFLYVVKGHKIVKVKNTKKLLRASDGIIIPKRAMHKVFSNKNTWALSIGY
jgi:mannose-6-phosphate isomerase-like protein (cupin superfamily)